MFRKLFIVCLLSVTLSACAAFIPPSETPPPPSPTTAVAPTLEHDPLVLMMATNQSILMTQVVAMKPTEPLTEIPLMTSTPVQPMATLTPVQPMATLTPTLSQTLQSAQSNDWVIKWLPGADKDRGDGTTFRSDAEKWTWRKVAPGLWKTFPNEPNKLVPEFPVVQCADDPTKQCVPDGLEYANPESNFCQQLAGEACRVPIAARHYHYFTGDYDVPNIGSCKENGTGIGCMLVIVNVGDVTSDFTGVFQQGFRLHARYWNGKALDMAIWGLTSHGVNTMINFDSKLNPNGINNAGANCSVPTGCKGVHVQTVFVSGNEPMLDLTTTVNK